MPRYFFNVDNGQDVARDHEGVELESLEIAMQEAIQDHLSFAIEALRRKQPLPVAYRIEICDERKTPIVEVPFSHAIDSLTQAA